MGLTSFIFSIFFPRAPGDTFIFSARFFISTEELGRNSCKGGSSNRTVTGNPSITLKISVKSPRCMGSSFFSASSWVFPSPAMIIFRTRKMRSSSKNICSVRHNPIPCAPKSRAIKASCGVSALALIRSDRTSPAQTIIRIKLLVNRGWVKGTAPLITWPVVPSKVIESNSLS